MCRPIGGNIYQNSNWLRDLKSNFQAVLVDTWSLKTKEAWNTNRIITDPFEMRKIRGEITNSLIEKLIGIHGTITIPTQMEIKSIIKEVLEVGYPFMFSKGEGTASEDPSLSHGRGLGGVIGIDNLGTPSTKLFFIKEGNVIIRYKGL